LLDMQTLPLSAYLVRELTRKHRLDSEEGHAGLLKSAKPLLDKISAPLLAALLKQKIAALAEVQPDNLARFGLGTSYAKNRNIPLPRGRRPAPSMLHHLARGLLMHPQRAQEIQPDWLDPDDPWTPIVVEMLTWLRPYSEPRLLSALIEEVRDTPLQTQVEALAADTLKLDENWDWNAELDATILQLQEDWKRRRIKLLSARPLHSLDEAERAELVSLSGL